MPIVVNAHNASRGNGFTLMGKLTGLTVHEGMPAAVVEVVKGTYKGKTATVFLDTDPERGGNVEGRPNLDAKGIGETLRATVGESVIAFERARRVSEDNEALVFSAAWPIKLPKDVVIAEDESLYLCSGFGGEDHACVLDPKHGVVLDQLDANAIAPVVEAALANEQYAGVSVFACDDENVTRASVPLFVRDESGAYQRLTPEQAQAKVRSLVSEGRFRLHTDNDMAVDAASLRDAGDDVRFFAVPHRAVMLSQEKYRRFASVYGVSNLGVPMTKLEGEDGVTRYRIDESALRALGMTAKEPRGIPGRVVADRLARQIELLSGAKQETSAREEAAVDVDDFPAFEDAPGQS